VALIDTIKPKIGVYYSDAVKDADVQGMIDAAILFFEGAGWDVGSTPDALAIEAIALYCKMSQSTDPAALTNHPVLLAMIAQSRIKPITCATPTATPVAGTYTTAQYVAIATTTPSATIRYTIDGSTPNADSDIYSGPIPITASTTVKAIAKRSGHYDSAMLTAAYVISGA
jgi:hypothetical protein